jgi:hypothetical protein
VLLIFLYLNAANKTVLLLRGDLKMHRWPYIWENNENRVVSHTPGLHPLMG